MGRSPCCDKLGLKKGPWTPEEDQKLLAYIEEHGHGSWRALPLKAGLQRCGKSCRLRWTNYLRPDIKRGKFSLQEEQTIIQLHALLGNRWSAIATHLPKRTDNEIKNYWNTHLKKRLAKMGIDPVTHKPKNDSILTSTDGGQSKNAANLSHMAQWESARLEAEARLVRQSKLISTFSNSFQAQKPDFATTTSSTIQKPVGPARCLDVLKSWNGWGDATEAANASVSVAGIGGDLGSPTSTLSSSVCDGGTMKEDWKQQLQVPFSTEDLLDTSSFQSTWAAESVTGNCSEHVPSGNFVEKFTDLLLSNSSADRRSGDGGESDNGGGSDYYENNKNYWDNILNLVNSSPPDSPIF